MTRNQLALALLLTVTLLFLPCLGWSAEPPANGENPSRFSYGPRGLQYESQDGNNFLWFGVRLQTRYSNEVVTQDELPDEAFGTQTDFALNRGRFKLGGHLLSPNLSVYSEYDFPTERLIDLRTTYQFSERLSLRIGQWKTEFNRERRDSSGEQQFAERSIVTPWFTIDRQQGAVFSGRVAADSAIDSSYWVGWISGAGRGGSLSEADGLWFGRYQWTFTGELLEFSQSDIGRRSKGAGSIAVAYVDGRTGFTSFSSAGGGQLPGFEDGAPDRYRLTQVVFETAWQKDGLSWQQEFHWKRIIDRQTGVDREITGGYAQFGAFVSRFYPSAPEPLELAVRVAAVDPDDDIEADFERELSLVGNWFFNGHRNKLTADIARVRRQYVPETDSRTRIRLQWDWSF